MDETKETIPIEKCELTKKECVVLNNIDDNKCFKLRTDDEIFGNNTLNQCIACRTPLNEERKKILKVLSTGKIMKWCYGPYIEGEDIEVKVNDYWLLFYSGYYKEVSCKSQGTLKYLNTQKTFEFGRSLIKEERVEENIKRKREKRKMLLKEKGE